MKQRTLFFSIPNLTRGGAERAILQLAGNFAANGYRCIVVTNNYAEDEYPLPDRVERIAAAQGREPGSLVKRTCRRYSFLRRLCRQYRPEAIISFMLEPNVRSLCATAGLPVKRIISVRNNPLQAYGGIAKGLIARYLLPLADGCIFQTEDARAWFPEKLQKKSIVVFNTVARTFFDTAYSGGRNIMTLGRLEHQKNHELLISAFARIAADFPECDLEIYGKGALREKLEEQVRACGLEGRVHLMGTTNESARLLSKTRLFVLSSDEEGMPNALMEALAVGVPCISTDCPCGGPRMLIRPGENGLLVPVGDVEALSDAMSRVLSDDAFAGRLGENAKVYAREFSPECVFPRVRAYIEKILEK